MKRMLIASLLALPFPPTALANTADSALLAAMALSDQPNYSWASVIDDDADSYEIVGQTSRDGFTRVTLPVASSVRRQLGPQFATTRIEAVFKGNVRCVLLTDDGWKTLDELPGSRGFNPELDQPPGANLMPRLGTARPAPVRSPAGRVIPHRTTRIRETERPYSNVQLAVSHPHEDLAVIVSSHTDWQVTGNVVTGTLNDLGAALLLVNDGQTGITPLQATGNFKLWIRDGGIVRYHLRLQGILSVDTPMGRRRVEVNQTSNTVVSNIGSTTVEVPTEVKRKLGT
jgi:hypothetical protein